MRDLRAAGGFRSRRRADPGIPPSLGCPWNGRILADDEIGSGGSRMRWFGRRSIHPEDYVGADEARNERIVRAGFVAKAKRYLNRLPLAHETVAMYFCMLDPKTPLWVKGTAAAALAYFILPADAIPDILPLVGMSDDAGVL